ncbi:MAG: hypothetical protein ACOC8E_00905 [Planctomycetota bacterium]
MSKHLRCAVFVCLALLVSVSSFGVEVELTVADHANVDRKSDVVTTGVPFTKGVVKDASTLCAKVDGRAIPAQFLKTVPWPDGSVRWALMDAQVDVAAGGKTEVVVTDQGANPAPKHPVRVKQTDAAVLVSTGPLQLVIDKEKAKFNPFASLRVDGRELVHGGHGLVLYMPGGRRIVAGKPDSVEIEQAGPMRAIVCSKGTFYGALKDLIRYTVRVTAYAGKKFVTVHVWLENQGKYGYGRQSEWLNFDGLAVDLGLPLAGEMAAKCEGAAAGDLTVEQLNPGHRFKTFKYDVYSGEDVVKSGKRTDGVVQIDHGSGRLTTAVRHFWQNYPKAIEVKQNKLTLWLWPRDGQWPRDVRRGASCNEFQQYRKKDLYALPGGVHKGHEFILDFSGRDPKATSATLSSPLMAQATPAYYAATEAAPGWFAPADFKTGKPAYDEKGKNWNRRAHNAIDRDNRTSLYAARRGAGERRGFWYGWMDFGDLCWQPGTSQLHYDWTWMMLINYLRQGDRGFLDIGTEMARHRIDVDQIWSDRVNKSYRGLTHYEKQYTDIHGGVKDGWYKPITSHHWACGVALYYMLTGEPKARECAIRSAKGVSWRQVDRYRNKPSAGGQLRATGWGILLLCSVYDMTADQHWLDEATVLFKNHVVPKWEKKGPHMDGGLQYYYSIDGLTRLHHRTGNEQLLEALRDGAKNEFKARYGEWKIHFSNLYGYLALVDKSQEHLKKGEQLFIDYVSDRESPRCYTGNGAWTKETGKRLRNGHILQYAKWKRKAE